MYYASNVLKSWALLFSGFEGGMIGARLMTGRQGLGIGRLGRYSAFLGRWCLS
jgi:hypothetical protein